jgi:hypothetical protein
MSARATWLAAVLVVTSATARADDDELAGEAAPAASVKPDAWAALDQDVRVRKVVVADFRGKGALRLRQAALDALSEHTEVEVIGANDVEVSAKSLGLSAHDASGREALSEQLGIYAWVDHDDARGSIVLIDAEGERLAELRVSDHRGSEADLRTTIWSTLGPQISDQGLRAHLLERMRLSASGKLKALDEESTHQTELALRREERRAVHLERSKHNALAVLQGEQAVVVQQQQLAMDRTRREQEEAARQVELARQSELARQQQLAQQAEAARQAELAHNQELARQAELARQQQLAQQAEAARQAELARQQQLAQQAAQAKQPPPQPTYVQQQPAYAAYPGNDGGAWQPNRGQPVYAQPQPAYAQPQPAYAQPQPGYAQPQPGYAQPQPGYAQPQPQPAYVQPQLAEPAPASASMPVSPATQAWLERRRAQQQQH